MPHKLKQTKGPHPKQPKTSRTLIPTEIRYAMLSDKVSGMSNCAIGRKHDKNPRQVFRTIKKAEERAERDNLPFLDRHNVLETPKKWGRKRKFTDDEKENIVSKVTSTRESRLKTAVEWKEELDLNCSESTFIRIMYERR
jgi:hypothetical protein